MSIQTIVSVLAIGAVPPMIVDAAKMPKGMKQKLLSYGSSALLAVGVAGVAGSVAENLQRPAVVTNSAPTLNN